MFEYLSFICPWQSDHGQIEFTPAPWRFSFIGLPTCGWSLLWSRCSNCLSTLRRGCFHRRCDGGLERAWGFFEGWKILGVIGFWPNSSVEPLRITWGLSVFGLKARWSPCGWWWRGLPTVSTYSWVLSVCFCGDSHWRQQWWSLVAFTSDGGGAAVFVVGNGIATISFSFFWEWYSYYSFFFLGLAH